jgi:Zn-dependent peptidase ImmA (M78 family)/DNA-binding transcriptional regulator YiaG
MSAVANFEWINPKSLEEARKRLRLAPEEVAQQAERLGSEYKGITAKALELWEAGRKEPELRHLEALSQIYVCPVGWFFLSNIPKEPFGLDFRGVAPGAKVGAPGMQTLSRFLELADWAEEVAIQTRQFAAPSIGQASLQDEMEQVVAVERRRLGFDAQVRSEWEDNDDAFNWWRRQIEGLGVFCFVMRLPTSEVRGASYWGKRGATFLLVNSEDTESATGRMFTLLHEYAHLMLRESLVCDFRGSREGTRVERFANRFSARMLLAPSEMKARLQELDAYQSREQWGDRTLDRIREPFRVSRDVIAIYLEELGFAPKGFYATRRGAWATRRSFGRSKVHPTGRTLPVQRLKMVGSTLARVLSSKQAEATLSTLDLAELLDVKVERVPAILDAFRAAGGDA